MAAPVPRLTFDKGTLVYPGDAPPTPHFRFDARTGACRAPAIAYREVVHALSEEGVPFEDAVWDADADAPGRLASGVTLREYQEEAVDAWEAGGRRGVVVMPTGAGKTVVALAAIEAVAVSTLVVVPTLDLVDQWRRRLREAFGERVGAVGGGERELAPLTVTTYDSAYLHAAKWGNRFRLVVFDEVHHLPSDGYRHVAEMLAAPYRLGLTATYERPDDLHERLPALTGPVVHEVTLATLEGEHLAPFTVERVHTDLTPEERDEYETHHKVYADLLAERREFRGVEGYKRLVMRSGSDPRVRRALLARNRARDVMMNSGTKLRELAKVLTRHEGERVLVFTEHNHLVRSISHRFLVPALTHRTHVRERTEILDRFRDGSYPVLVTGKVLDEGVDVPDASVGVILSGSGSRREFVQRLGRILRPAPGKQARLYEIVSRDTTEEDTSDRRRGQGRWTKRDAGPGISPPAHKDAEGRRDGVTETDGDGRIRPSDPPTLRDVEPRGDGRQQGQEDDDVSS